MLDPQVRCVVGIDVAKRSHVVCALEVPSGQLRQRPQPVAASPAGYAELQGWLAAWGGPGRS